MPMKTTSGLVSLTATAPTDALLIWPSVTGAHVSPPSIVFQRPPPTAPKYASFLRPLTPVAAMDRPPRSGPSARHLNDFASVVSSVCAKESAGGTVRPKEATISRSLMLSMAQICFGHAHPR